MTPEAGKIYKRVLLYEQDGQVKQLSNFVKCISVNSLAIRFKFLQYPDEDDPYRGSDHMFSTHTANFPVSVPKKGSGSCHEHMRISKGKIQFIIYTLLEE